MAGYYRKECLIHDVETLDYAIIAMMGMGKAVSEAVWESQNQRKRSWLLTG